MDLLGNGWLCTNAEKIKTMYLRDQSRDQTYLSLKQVKMKMHQRLYAVFVDVDEDEEICFV